MRNIKTKIYGWKPCDSVLYNKIYQMYGGSLCTHPQVLSYIRATFNVDVNYFYFEYKGEPVAAIFSLNGTLRYYNPAIPFVFDDLLFPVRKDLKFLMPFKSKRLSPKQQQVFYNGVYSRYLKNKIAYIKKDFSLKTVKKRNSEVKRFMSSGGEVRNVDEFSARELARIYHRLFRLRWGSTLPGIKTEVLTDVISEFRDMIFGNVLLINDIPCAYDLNYRVNCPLWTYIDDFNGGIDPTAKHLGVGSVLLWQNIQDARKTAEKSGVDIIYSLGAYNKAWEYKKQWCEIELSGRIVF